MTEISQFAGRQIDKVERFHVDGIEMADRERSGGDSSSEEEDPKWKAAINSIATTTVYGASATKPAATQTHENGDFRIKPKKLTHGQIKVSHYLDIEECNEY